MDVDWSKHSPAAKSRHRAPAAEQCLVDIVVEDLTEPAAILPAKIARQGLGERVADRIRMPKTFAFDDFDRLGLILKRGYDESLHARTRM